MVPRNKNTQSAGADMQRLIILILNENEGCGIPVCQTGIDAAPLQAEILGQIGTTPRECNDARSMTNKVDDEWVG